MQFLYLHDRRLEEMELRLAAQEQRSGEDKMRMELLEDAAAESTSCQVSYPSNQTAKAKAFSCVIAPPLAFSMIIPHSSTSGECYKDFAG